MNAHTLKSELSPKLTPAVVGWWAHRVAMCMAQYSNSSATGRPFCSPMQCPWCWITPGPGNRRMGWWQASSVSFDCNWSNDCDTSAVEALIYTQVYQVVSQPCFSFLFHYKYGHTCRASLPWNVSYFLYLLFCHTCSLFCEQHISLTHLKKIRNH